MGTVNLNIARIGLIYLLAQAACNQLPQEASKASSGTTTLWTLEEITAAREGCAARANDLGAVDLSKLASICSCIVEDAAKRWSADDWLRNMTTYTQAQVKDGTVERCRVAASPNIGGSTWSQVEIAQVRQGCIASARQVQPTVDEAAIILGCGCVVEDASKRWEFPDYIKNESSYTKKQSEDGTMMRCMAGTGGGQQVGNQPTVVATPISANLKGVWETGCIQATQSLSVRNRWELEGDRAIFRLIEYNDGTCGAIIRTKTDIYSGKSDGGNAGDYSMDLVRADAYVKYADPVYALIAWLGTEWGYSKWPIWIDQKVTDRQEKPGLLPEFPLNERRYDLFRVVGDRLYQGDSTETENRRSPEKRPKDANMFLAFTKSATTNHLPTAGMQPELSVKIGGTANNYPVVNDADGDSLSVTCVGPCPEGLTVNENTYSYTPTRPGTTTANMIVRDAKGASANFTLGLVAKKEFRVYHDNDGDGYGAGTLLTVEAPQENIPAGYVPNGTDCADGDVTKWQSLSYSFRDMDGDGYTILTTQGTVCTGANLPHTFKAESNGTDCADTDATKWQSLPYSYRDMDGDGYTTVSTPGTICAGSDLPATYKALPNGNDCTDSDRTKWRAVNYRDKDGDGYTVYNPIGICVGEEIPPGYSISASGNDCDDNNATKWQSMSYAFRDADGDGLTVPSSGNICTNSNLPVGFLSQGNGYDCDDSDGTKWRNINYRDQDGDGYTVHTTETMCIGNLIPSGYAVAPNGNDCADSDATKWQNLSYRYRDLDGDGYTVATNPANICVGSSLPPSYTSVANGNDCDDVDPTSWQMLDYNFTHTTGDIYWALKRGSLCSGSSLKQGYMLTSGAGPYRFGASDASFVSKLSSGVSHSCQILADGALTCWGDNSFGQLGNGSNNSSNSPIHVSALTSAVLAVSTGRSHSCAITSLGSLKCWGSNINGQLGDGTNLSKTLPTQVIGLESGVIAVSASENHTCAILASGGLKCWGSNIYGQLGDGTNLSKFVPSQVTGLESGVVAVDLGMYHTCAVFASGSVKCWGSNSAYQLGNGSNVSTNIPTQVTGLESGVVAITAGSKHSCSLLDSGSAKCWGSGTGSSQTGTTPKQVQNLQSGVVSIQAGGDHTCSILVSGTAYCWGNNAEGQLGNGSLIESYSPTQIGGVGSSVLALALGLNHTCAMTTSSTKCWGNNNYGQLGDGNKSSTHIFTQVSGLESGVTYVASRDSHTCAILNTGSLKCWGDNEYGQLGDGTRTRRYVPTQVAGLETGVVEVATGLYHTCARLNSGVLKCWGLGTYGQLGNGSSAPQLIPVSVSGLETGALKVSAGSYHTCALLVTGAVRCWGHNGHGGQIGNGTATQLQFTPSQVVGLESGVSLLGLGGTHSCAGTTNGLKCWGSNYGNIPTQVSGLGNDISDVKGGDHYSCAINSSGGVNCWENGSTPSQVSGLDSGVSSIAAGAQHRCAITSGGLACWGDNKFGQVGNVAMSSSTPTLIHETTDIMHIAAGKDHTCAIINPGKLNCWGSNNEGQLGNGYSTLNPVEVIFPN